MQQNEQQIIPQIAEKNNQQSAQAEFKKKSHRLFLDDTEYQSFVRRLAWSPDGSFMLTPGSMFCDF